MGEPEGKEPLGRIGRRKKGGIKKNLLEIGLGAGTELIWIKREAGDR